jgi:hypothetical protein
MLLRLQAVCWTAWALLLQDAQLLWLRWLLGSPWLLLLEVLPLPRVQRWQCCTSLLLLL